MSQQDKLHSKRQIEYKTELKLVQSNEDKNIENNLNL